MISIHDARRVAEKFLDENVRDRFGHEVIIVEGSVRDDGARWVFPYNGKAYVERDDWHQAMAGNVPVVVDKVTGVAAFAPATGH